MKGAELVFAFQRATALIGQSPADFQITPLPGYTNQNFRLVKDDFDAVLRIPRAATNAYIDRRAEAANQALAADLGIAPRPLWRDADGLSLTPTLNNTRGLQAHDLVDAPIRARLLRSLQQLHRSKARFEGRIELAQLLEKYYALLDTKQQADLSDRMTAARRLLPTLGQRDCDYVPSHNDLVLENLMDDGERVWLIDWEFSAMASPCWDLATLCNAAKLDHRQSRELLNLYCADGVTMEESLLFDYRNLLQLLTDIWMAALVD